MINGWAVKRRDHKNIVAMANCEITAAVDNRLQPTARTLRALVSPVAYGRGVGG